jgi:hypothetical protein
MNAPSTNYWLLAAGCGCLAASLFHLVGIIGGPDWYRFAGAGERVAQAAARGSWYPPFIACVIAGILAGWAVYAFSGAGVIIKLPLARTALFLISAVLMLRAAAFFWRGFWRPDLSVTFMIWSSLIVLVLGLCFSIGTWQAWSALSVRQPL